MIPSSAPTRIALNQDPAGQKSASWLAAMAFEIQVVGTITKIFDFRKLDRITDVFDQPGLGATISALVPSRVRQAGDHIFTTFCGEAAHVHVVALNRFAETFYVFCHGGLLIF
jgi:hypothetical protein